MIAVKRLLSIAAAIAMTASCGGDGPTGPDVDGTVALKVALEVVPLSLQPVRNAAFNAQLSAQGGVAPYTWSVASGSLPAGLTLATTGRITGTPTTATSFTFTASVKDAANATSTLQYTGSVAASGTVPFELTAAPMLVFGKDQDLSFQPGVQGGAPPYTFAITGLPPGVTFNAVTGTLSGKPTATGTFTVTVTITDSQNRTATSAPVTVMVVASLTQPTGNGAAKYAGTWAGQFNMIWEICPSGYDWPGGSACTRQNPDGSTSTTSRLRKSAGFSVTVVVEALGAGNGAAGLLVKSANISHSAFGCQPCTAPSGGNIGVFVVEDPPANINTMAGVGIAIQATNGAVLVNANSVGAVHMSSTGTLISNSLNPDIQPYSWLADIPNGSSFEASVEPLYLTGAGFEMMSTSWVLVKSAL